MTNEKDQGAAPEPVGEALTEREAFEAWFLDYCGAGPQDAVFDQLSTRWLDRRPDGEYEVTRVRDAWVGWIGRSARAAVEAYQESAGGAVQRPVIDDRANEIAAQVWCDPSTSMIEMDVRLAAQFAHVLRGLFGDNPEGSKSGAMKEQTP